MAGLTIGPCQWGKSRGVIRLPPASNLGRRTRLKAAAAKVNAHPIRSTPRSFGRFEARDGLDRAEALVDALADPLARCIAGVAGRPPIERRAAIPARKVLYHVRAHVHGAELVHEVLRVVAAVGAAAFDQCAVKRSAWLETLVRHASIRRAPAWKLGSPSSATR
jgi:hypothetical protein